jgi:hypothetical protein
MEKTLTPEESLQIIQKSISNSRKNMREGSFYYLLWGWALILASLANYFLTRYLIRHERYDDIMLMSLLAWGVFLVAVVIVQFVYLSRKGKKGRVITHLDRYLKLVWITGGMLMGLMTFLSLKVGAYPTPFILGVTAMATALSGLVTRFRPLVIGALVFLCAAVISSFLNGTDQLLVFAVAMVLGYLIPGYIIRSIKNGDHV